MMEIHRDAFSDGQIRSKLWLCEELERALCSVLPDSIGRMENTLFRRIVPSNTIRLGDGLSYSKPLTIWVYGGWYCLTNMLLRTRNNLAVKNVCSFDIDAQCTTVARLINNAWECDGSFRAFTEDCNRLCHEEPGRYESERPDLIINTAVEHFHEDQWFDAIPKGTRLALQSNDMAHVDHVSLVECIDSLIQRYPLTTLEFAGEKKFCYPQLSYTRFMIIGYK